MPQVLVNTDTTISVDLAQTGEQVLQQAVPDATRLPLCTLFFGGRRIARDQRLADVPGLDESSRLRVVVRKAPSTAASVADVDVAGAAEAVAAFPEYAERFILDYLTQKTSTEKLFKDFPGLLEDPALYNVVSDYPLLCAMVNEEHGFIQHHPEYVNVVKRLHEMHGGNQAMRALNQLNARFPRPTRMSSRGVQRAVPRVVPPVENDGSGSEAAPSNVITSEMLRAAIANSLLHNSNPPSLSTPSSSSVNHTDPPPPSASTVTLPSFSTESAVPPAELSVAASYLEQFAPQLAQLHDFGFLDDNDNVGALLGTDGNVEQAIDLLVAMRN